MRLLPGRVSHPCCHLSLAVALQLLKCLAWGSLYASTLEPLPEAVEVGEVDRLPEPAEPPVAYPAADGQYPPHDHDSGHPVNPFVIAPGRHNEGEGAEYRVGRKESFKQSWFLSASANATEQNPASFFWRVFISPQELEKCGSVEGFWLSVGEDDPRRCQGTPLSLPRSWGQSPNPTLVPKSSAKGKELQRWQLGRKRCTCPMDCPHSAWHLGQRAFLCPTAHSPACASSWVPSQAAPVLCRADSPTCG